MLVFGFLGVGGHAQRYFPSHHFLLYRATDAQRFKPGVEAGSSRLVQIEQAFWRMGFSVFHWTWMRADCDCFTINQKSPPCPGDLGHFRDIVPAQIFKLIFFQSPCLRNTYTRDGWWGGSRGGIRWNLNEMNKNLRSSSLGDFELSQHFDESRRGVSESLTLGWEGSGMGCLAGWGCLLHQVYKNTVGDRPLPPARNTGNSRS